MHSGAGNERWTYLVYNCISMLCSNLFQDELSGLNGRLQGTVEDCTSGKDPTCLNFTASQFNGIYVSGFWIGSLISVLTGFFVARYGIWKSSYLTALVFFAGTTLFVLGPYCSDNASAFTVMLVGRLVASIGGYGNFVVTGEVKSHWFLGKELALAFSIYFCFGRLGSIISFASVGSLLQLLGLQYTLWVLWSINQVGTVSFLLAGWIYRKHTNTPLDEKVLQDSAASVKFNLSTLGHLGTSCWLMCAVIFFFYGTLNSLLADGTKFLIEMYHYSEAKAAVVIGIIPDISLIAPIIGWLIDKYGNRDVVTSLSSLFLLLACLITAPIPTDAAMIVGLSCVAVSFSMNNACFWSNIPVLVSLPVLAGVGIGAAIASELLASGLLLLVSGFILDNTSQSKETRWMNFFVLITLFAVIAVIFTVVLIWYDWKKGGWRLRRNSIGALPAIMAAEGTTASLADEAETPILQNQIRISRYSSIGSK